MFVVYCPSCDRRTLLGVDEVEWVQNLAPGMISVAGHCPQGHDVVVLTGDAFTPHEDPRYFGPLPSMWVRVCRGPATWLGRVFALHDRVSAVYDRVSAFRVRPRH